MAKNASHADGNRGGKRVTREVGQRGNTRPRADRSVRRANEVASSPRIQRALAEQQAHEERLAKLAEELAQQEHIPYRPSEEDAKVYLMDPRRRPLGDALADAMEASTRHVDRVITNVAEARTEAFNLLTQGYHLDRVAARTGVHPSDLEHLVGPDGYYR